MKSTYLSSTKLKRKTAEILNMVAYGEVIAIIERYGEPLVKIVPIVPSEKGINVEKKLKKYFGAIPNFPDVSKKRHFRKRTVDL